METDLNHILDQTGGLWEELMGQRLFITGGTGFFGTWLLESFACANFRLALGARALVLTRDPEAFRQRQPRLAANPAIELLRGDVRSFEFPAGRFSHVIHAATDASAKLNEENPELMLDTIVEGTERALDFAAHAGAKKFLLASSGAVYGRQPPELTHVPEEYPGAPDPLDVRSAYGQGKRLAEHLCALRNGKAGLETKVARCFAFVGPHLPLDIHFAIGNFIRDGLKGGPIQVGGDGTPYRSYLYAADLAAWLWTILIRGTPGRAYNVGSEEQIDIGSLARLVAGKFGTEANIAKKPVPGRAAERYVPSTARARSELGLQAWIGLEEAIRRTIQWNRTGHRAEERSRA